VLFDFVLKFWNGDDDFSEWHEGLGALVPKKGDLHDLNKWCLINLMDVGSKILSCILTQRAYTLLKLHCVETQFGATPLVGCPDGNFSRKTLLHLRHQHNLPSYVAFVDLVKAYDTANHQILVDLLGRYGAPQEFCNIISRLYSDLTVTINVEGQKIVIPQTCGVRQGDNLSPVLFLFVMSAVAECLNKEIDDSEIKKVECRRVNIENLSEGVLISQPAHKLRSGESFQLLEILYIDDGAFIFNSRTDLSNGLNMLRTHFANFGLEVHIGRGEIASKTECMYIPEPGRFALKEPIAYIAPPPQSPTTNQSNQAPNLSIIPISPQKQAQKRESDKAKKIRCDREYDLCTETERIWLDNGSFVDFTKEFVYLGSIASYDLTEEADIKRKISKASQAIGALANLWHNPYIDLKTKHSFFLAFPINLVLWGCESWALKESTFQKLDSFLHRSVRRIL
jgi:hypothetical protein